MRKSKKEKQKGRETKKNNTPYHPNGKAPWIGLQQKHTLKILFNNTLLFHVQEHKVGPHFSIKPNTWRTFSTKKPTSHSIRLRRSTRIQGFQHKKIEMNTAVSNVRVQTFTSSSRQNHGHYSQLTGEHTLHSAGLYGTVSPRWHIRHIAPGVTVLVLAVGRNM